MNAVEKQYKNADNLNIRISIHQKYSVNQQPFGEWIMEHYEIRPGFRILELGCGTADMWKGKHHLHEYNIEGRIGDRFLLQNGGEILSTWFSKVERYDREDGLAVTNVRNFVSYVKSLTNLTGLDVVDAETLQIAFEKRTAEGVLFVPKQYGMFACIK